MLKLLIRISAMALITIGILVANPTNPKTVEINSLSEADLPKQKANSLIFEAKIKAKKDDRAAILKKFLTSRNSPMAKDSDKLVQIADKYNLDWKLLPAIAGVESHYGQAIPSGSYNPYGWNNGGAYFKDWGQASETVASGIRNRYAPTGEVNPYRIGPTYAANPAWASHVASYMYQLDQI